MKSKYLSCPCKIATRILAVSCWESRRVEIQPGFLPRISLPVIPQQVEIPPRISPGKILGSQNLGRIIDGIPYSFQITKLIY